MKIAVATEDGVSISQHFGRSRSFLVFDVAGKTILGQSVRDNTFTAHARGECQEGDEHHHDQHHGHDAIVEALQDCRAVLCGGMGWRAADALNQQGVQAVLVPATLSPAEAVAKHLAGELGTTEGFCRCQH